MQRATTTTTMTHDPAVVFATIATTPSIRKRITMPTTTSPMIPLHTTRARITHTVHSQIIIGRMTIRIGP